MKRTERYLPYTLLFSVFVIATCGLIYELVAGTLASYLLGDSVMQFSTIIGVYLFSMGIGSWLSRYIQQNIPSTFIRVELLIALVGGFSSSLLFLLFEWVTGFRIILYGLVGITGIMVGLEIPLLMRILKDKFEFKDLVSQIFTFDYIGALIASVLFPLLLVPVLGLIRTSMLFGLMNAGIAIWAIYLFRHSLKSPRLFYSAGISVCLLLIFGMIGSDQILKFSEQLGYPGKVIFASSSPYQRIVLTRQSEDVRLYLNGNLQFSSRDEYRYHEALVHPGLARVSNPKKVLILGGGDGLAVREILKYPDLESILLVDLDPAITRIFSDKDLLNQLNDSSLHHPKVQIQNADAFSWIRACESKFDFVVIDFPDPSNYSLGKLYSQSFYQELARILSPKGHVVVQSTSPLVARKSFWCIENTMASAGLNTLPYHTYVPSFGEWGYILAAKEGINLQASYPASLRYLSDQTFAQMVYFPPDMDRLETEVNKLNNQVLIQYFEKEWAVYVE